MLASRTWSTAGARLARSALAYVVVLSAIVTLAPLDFRVGQPTAWSVLLLPGDFVRNVAFFIPLGFLAALADGSRFALWRAPLAATLYSVALEAAQRWLPGRFPSVADVAANGFGAFIGALLAVVLAGQVIHRQGMRAVGVLGAPLLGLLYLLTPLLWIGSLAGTQDGRLLVLVLAAIGGAVVMRAISLHQMLHLDARGVPPAREHLGLAALVAAWFLIGIAPGDWSDGMGIAAATVAVAAIGAVPWLDRERRLVAAQGGGRPRRERRFETRTLLQLAPLFATYLVAQACWPLPDTIVEWRWANGFAPSADALDRAAILAVVERVAAFTVLGYGMAEWRSRITETPSRMRWASMAPVAAVAALLEALRGAHPSFGANVWLFGASVVSAWVGVELFRTHRDFIVELLMQAAEVVDRARAMAIPALREEIPVPLGTGPVRALPSGRTDIAA
ncbi:MAG: VanZ family protein [Gemmatimonadaceae bacterium]|jgi:VanZ family protein|nr:VanZ family protein [Gemmatimonadaceae bacterium]